MKSGYTGLWLLLALSLAIMIAVSFADDISYGDFTLKRATFKETLLADREQERQEAEIADSVAAEERRVQQEEKAPVDSTRQSILLIGDSMTMNLALRLAQYAAANGHEFHAVNWDSSNTVKWSRSTRLRDYIKEFDATYVFISLGANELYLANPDSHVQYVEGILDQVGDLPYVWIGPPNWKEDKGINDMIDRVCRPGSFFRSAGMTFKRKKDGVHPTRESSAEWMDSVVRWMPKSSHPILIDAPADSLKRVNANLILLKASDK
ncbi:MAG: SGNH/GDSL hydrolase family protein [Bacteroides sp.]|nr:SGNH/GDSL hydrolase family protein [Bacteroides sp.]